MTHRDGQLQLAVALPLCSGIKRTGASFRIKIELCAHAGFFTLKGNMDIRTAGERRSAKPFGTSGPWLTTGKMGGLVFTERRKIDRRSADKVTGISSIDGLELCYP